MDQPSSRRNPVSNYFELDLTNLEVRYAPTKKDTFKVIPFKDIEDVAVINDSTVKGDQRPEDPISIVNQAPSFSDLGNSKFRMMVKTGQYYF
jgi:hypothetical protein